VGYGLNTKANKIEEACKAACIYNWIMGFKTQYNTKIRKEGVKLLGGERQRIAIARAIFKNLKILFLNKAIFAIDNLIKILICKSLKSQAEGRTTLFIAYYFNIIRDVDKIIVLEKREVIERGSYTELLS